MRRPLKVQLLATTPPHLAFERVRWTQAQLDGLKHERRVNRYLGGEFGDWYMPGPWIRYKAGELFAWRVCQPDGLLFSPSGRLIIVESKLAHTSKAYRQLAGLYAPCLAKLLPAWQIVFLEVVRWYRSDAITGARYPIPVKLVKEPLEAEAGAFNVWIFGDRDGEEKSDYRDGDAGA